MSRAERRAQQREAARRLAGYRPTRGDRARHEAGHAVACLVLDAPFDHVDISLATVANGASGLHRVRGLVEFTAKPFDTAVILLAGPLAEGTWLGGLEDMAKVKALDPDWVRAAHPWSPKGTASRLVSEHRAAIEAVAAGLLEKGALSCAEAAALAAVGR